MSQQVRTATVDDVELPSGDVFVAGRWRPGSGEEITSVYPADGSVNRTFALASVDDVDEAVALGLQAQRSSGWATARPADRATVLYRIADLIASEAPRIAAVQTRDTGKTLTETTALARSAAGTFRYVAAALETMDEDLTSPRGDYLSMSVHQPLGVVGAITPWNSPIASDAQKVAPALAAGNAVVLKPATWAPLTSLELAWICQQAGLPDGLLSVLPGSGSGVGDRVVRHPDVRKVSFTGGTATGLRVAAAAAEKLMPVSLELGGKSPTVVFADADVDQALAGVLYGIFSSTGQSCIAGSRLFVQEALYERFVEELVRRTERLRVGSPTDPTTQVAPLVHEDHRASVEAFIDRAVADGGQILAGGVRPTGPLYDAGSYLRPTIIGGLDNAATVCREEIFGPVLVVLPFRDEQDLVEQANDSVYGLACGIWTADYRRAWRVAQAIDAGTVWVNTYKQFSIATPFGGTKASGLGREKGRLGIREYMSQKSIYWGLSEAPLPWAGAPASESDGVSST